MYWGLVVTEYPTEAEVFACALRMQPRGDDQPSLLHRWYHVRRSLALRVADCGEEVGGNVYVGGEKRQPHLVQLGVNVRFHVTMCLEKALHAAGGGMHLLEAQAEGANQLHSGRGEVRRLPCLVVLHYWQPAGG